MLARVAKILAKAKLYEFYKDRKIRFELNFNWKKIFLIALILSIIAILASFESRDLNGIFNIY